MPTERDFLSVGTDVLVSGDGRFLLAECLEVLVTTARNHEPAALARDEGRVAEVDAMLRRFDHVALAMRDRTAEGFSVGVAQELDDLGGTVLHAVRLDGSVLLARQPAQ